MSLESAAAKAAPIYGGGLDLSRPEEQLIEAFQKARAALFSALPSNARLDATEATLAADLVQQQIQIRQSIVTSHLESGTDLPLPDAITLESPKSRQYYIGKYIAASQGLGGYPAGLGREAVAAGAMSQQDYVDGMEVRLRAFSDIIYAGNNGQLSHLVNAEAVGGDVVIQSVRTGVISGTGTSGVGAIAVGTIVLVGIVSAILVGGAAYYFTQKHRIDKTITMMSQNCNDAIKLGNDKAIKYCNEFAKETVGGGAIKDIIGVEGQSQILKYLGYAGAAYLAILLLPSITSSVMSAQEVRARKAYR